MRTTSDASAATDLRSCATDLGALAGQVWDAVIVGAGPAGGISAAILAGRGWRVLLVDRAKFPRDKVCGGCINAAAAQALADIGLGSLLRGAGMLEQFQLRVMGRQINVPLPRGYAISRSEFDAGVVAAAVARGCWFADGISARLLPAEPSEKCRRIGLRRGGGEIVARARVVLACDGISGTLMDDEPGAAWKTASDSWFGVSTEISSQSLAAGVIEMNVGSGGYAGLVRLAGNRVHVGAALDISACRAAGGPARLIASILRECNQSAPSEMDTLKLQGTGRLTRRRNKIGGFRVLAVGDACGYVEPFTGEGISWAIRGACEITELLAYRASDWPENLPEIWMARHRAIIGRSQVICRALRQIAHRPGLAAACVGMASVVPVAATMIAKIIGQGPVRSSGRNHSEFSAAQGVV